MKQTFTCKPRHSALIFMLLVATILMLMETTYANSQDDNLEDKLRGENSGP